MEKAFFLFSHVPEGIRTLHRFLSLCLKYRPGRCNPSCNLYCSLYHSARDFRKICRNRKYRILFRTVCTADRSGYVILKLPGSILRIIGRQEYVDTTEHSLPFPAFFNSKIAVTMSIHAVGYLIALPVFLIRFHLDTAQSATLIVIPAVYSVFTAVQGICINCCFPRFDWDNEIVVIKQSMAVILSGMLGIMSTAVPALLHWFLKLPLQTVLWGWAAILLCTAGLLYWKTCQIKII